MNKVPEKQKIGQWPYISKLFSQCNFTAQIEPVQENLYYIANVSKKIIWQDGNQLTEWVRICKQQGIKTVTVQYSVDNWIY